MPTGVIRTAEEWFTRDSDWFGGWGGRQISFQRYIGAEEPMVRAFVKSVNYMSPRKWCSGSGAAREEPCRIHLSWDSLDARYTNFIFIP